MRQNNFKILGLMILGLMSTSCDFKFKPSPEGIIWVSNCNAETSFKNGFLHVIDGKSSFDVPPEPTKKILIKKFFGETCKELEP